jgi:hypothetical protein
MHFASHGIVTLTTDFGSRDIFAGVMKGVILGINPTASIVDITHDIPPQDLRTTAISTEAAAACFSAGTTDVGAILGHLIMPNEPYPFPISPGGLFALDITLAGGSASVDLLLFLAAGAFTADD